MILVLKRCPTGLLVPPTFYLLPTPKESKDTEAIPYSHPYLKGSPEPRSSGDPFS